MTIKIPFLGQAYASRSPILASQTAINIYPELTEGNSDEVGAFYGTPGLTAVFTGNGEVRGIRAAGGALYAVIGSVVYKLTANYLPLVLGNLPNSSGRVSMTNNDVQLAIGHVNGWHYVPLSGNTILPVVNAPLGSILTSQDQYVIFTKNDDGRFGITALNDLSSINPLDVATAAGAPDGLIAVLSDHREVWLFGAETCEIWSNTGRG